MSIQSNITYEHKNVKKTLNKKIYTKYKAETKM